MWQRLRALSACSGEAHYARVVVHVVVGLMLVLSARVIVVFFVVEFCVHAQMLCILRVFMFMSLHLLLMWLVS